MAEKESLLRELIEKQKKRLRDLEKQRSVYGERTPDEIESQIEELSEQIATLEQELEEMGVGGVEISGATKWVGSQVGGDKVSGDRISVGDVSGMNVAIGRGASSKIRKSYELDRDFLNQVFAALSTLVAQEEPAAVAMVHELKAEIRHGKDADDEKVADLISEIAEAAPAVVDTLVELFSNPEVIRAAGGATKYVLKRIGR